MSRAKVVRKAIKIDSDPIYNSKLISKIINCSMYDGKKDTAMKGIYGSLAKIQSFIADEYAKKHKKQETSEEDSSNNSSDSVCEKQMTVWFVEEVINNIAPAVEIRSRRIGGANYQIPVALSPKRKLGLSIRWLVDGARARKERGMIDKFVAELKDAINSKGEAIKKRDSMHKIAEANKAFAHYGTNG